jgi:hypothetical protein
MIRRCVSLLLVVVASLAISAQTSDLAVSIDAPETARTGEPFTFSGTVVNNGPDRAWSVSISMEMAGTRCYDSSEIGTLDAGFSRTFTCSGIIPPQVYRMGLLFGAQTESDPRTIDNFAFVDKVVQSPADLRVWGYLDAPAAPGLPTTVRIFYGNDAWTAADDVTVRLATAGTFSELPSFCVASGGEAVCNLGRVEARGDFGAEPKSFVATIIAPDRSAATFDVDLSIAAAGPDAYPENNQFTLGAFTYRTAFVRTTADRGPGSLRAAIDQSNAECVDAWPCLIAFRIPADDAHWHTVTVTEPLPAILRRAVLVDGTTQSRYFGDTNAAGPEIELSGAGLATGSGIEIVAACTSSIRGLAINGFPTSAVRVGSVAGCNAQPGFPGQPFAYQRAIEKNYIGTDPTGATAKPNGIGVYVDGTNGGWAVVSNVIAGNQRSGVFADGGINLITSNIIGLNAGFTAPLGNEASGVYVGPRADGTDIVNNAIGFNHHFGIAIDADAENVAIFGNSFQANRQLAIDRGLDGVTTTGIPLPEITAAYFNGEETIVEIAPGPVGGTFNARVQVYASDAPDPSGFGEGQYYLGEAEQTGQGKYLFHTAADLTGLWIAATNTRTVYNGWITAPGVKSHGDTGWGYLTATSEFGRAVEVR